jgi:predicted Zn-dependent protease
MKKLLFMLLCLLPLGCSATGTRVTWSARELALARAPVIHLQRPTGEIAAVINTPTVQKLMLAHIRITRSANVQADLIIYDDDQPNAFAGLVNDRRVIGINTAMLKLLGDDISALAALLGHESAHCAKGHADQGSMRSGSLQALGTLMGVGLGSAGVPGAGYITGLGADLIDAAYSRDDEREADALGIDYMIANSFDPSGAVRLHEKLLAVNNRLSIPFLSTHPSSEERIENFKNLIAEKTTAR